MNILNWFLIPHGWGNPKATIEGIKPTPSGGAVEVNFSVVDGEKISVKSISVTVLPLATGVKVKLGDEENSTTLELQLLEMVIAVSCVCV